MPQYKGFPKRKYRKTQEISFAEYCPSLAIAQLPNWHQFIQKRVQIEDEANFWRVNQNCLPRNRAMEIKTWRMMNPPQSHFKEYVVAVLLIIIFIVAVCQK